MREIRFRGYATEKMIGNQWLYGFGVMNIDYADGTKEYLLYTIQGTYEVLPESIGQYTGLTDKNGREIYEGDIIHCRYLSYIEFNAVVCFGKYEQDGSGGEYMGSTCVGFYAEAININKEDDWGNRIVPEYAETASLLDFDRLEVIGNIYQHKHLLKEKD